MIKNRCDECTKEVPDAHGVNTTIKDKSLFLCAVCWNKYISKRMGINFKLIDVKLITLDDCEGIPHTFHIQTLFTPGGLKVEAKEILKGGKIGYHFAVLEKDSSKQADLILDLYAKIKRGLSNKYIKKSQGGDDFIKDQTVVGRIEWDDNYNGDLPELWIDGRRITWTDFGKLLMSFEGWQFKMDIVDPCDDIK